MINLIEAVAATGEAAKARVYDSIILSLCHASPDFLFSEQQTPSKFEGAGGQYQYCTSA